MTALGVYVLLLCVFMLRRYSLALHDSYRPLLAVVRTITTTRLHTNTQHLH
jgi:hypothetical protein